MSVLAGEKKPLGGGPFAPKLELRKELHDKNEKNIRDFGCY